MTADPFLLIQEAAVAADRLNRSRAEALLAMAELDRGDAVLAELDAGFTRAIEALKALPVAS